MQTLAVVPFNINTPNIIPHIILSDIVECTYPNITYLDETNTDPDTGGPTSLPLSLGGLNLPSHEPKAPNTPYRRRYPNSLIHIYQLIPTLARQEFVL